MKIACWATLEKECISQADFEKESGMSFPEGFDPKENFDVVFSRILPVPPMPETEIWAYGDQTNEYSHQSAAIRIEKAYEIVVQKGGEPYARVYMDWNDAGRFNSLGYTIAVFKEIGWDVSILQDDNKII